MEAEIDRQKILADLVRVATNNTNTAEDYIFERMVETYCNERTRGDIAAVEKFLKSANHRIVDVDSPATQEFKKKLASQAAELEKQIPGLSLH